MDEYTYTDDLKKEEREVIIPLVAWIQFRRFIKAIRGTKPVEVAHMTPWGEEIPVQ